MKFSSRRLTHDKNSFHYTDIEMITSTNCNTARALDATNSSCNATQTSLNSSPNRLMQSPPNDLTNTSIHHTITQPYLGDSSNFGAFYHHHHHSHLNYGNPYDKYKIPPNVHYSRSPNASPYGSYQGFYSPNPTHHHHQIGRPNGYIDVPR